MYVFRKRKFSDNLQISNARLISMNYQESKIIISYSNKEEYLPIVRTNEEIFIKANELMLTDDIKLFKDRILVSLKGRSRSVLKEHTQLIENNFNRVPKFVSAVVIIIAYILDKAVTVFNFLNFKK